MKHYAYTIIILLLFAACRSNRTVDHRTEGESNIEEGYTKSSTDDSRHETERTDTTHTIQNEVFFARTTEYNPDGTIRQVREEWRETGSSQLGTSRTRSSGVSLKKEEVTHHRKLDFKFTESLKELTKTDSRLIQGSEWFWVVFAGILLLLIGGVFAYRKLKK